MRRELALAVVGGLLAIPSIASAATTRWATPSPDVVNDCTEAHPCDIAKAILTVGQADDEVIVLPGTYDISQNGFSTKDRMNVHGLDGSPRPVINNTATIGLAAIGANSTVRYLKITATGAGGGGGGAALDVENGSTVENVIAEGLAANNPNGCQTEGGVVATVTIRNSVCKSDGLATGVVASDIDGPPHNFNTTTLRNVTALSVSGTGLAASNVFDKTVIVNAVNTIARGGTFDVQAFHTGTAAANVNLSYSNYSSTNTVGGSAVITDQGHNQSGQPQLTSDFHQQPGSPTVDAGVNDAANGATDFDGDVRSLGSGVTDIGADEYVPAPLVTTDDPTGVGQTTATLNGTVNPESRDTTYHFEFGTSTAYGFSTPTTGVGSGTTPIAVQAPLNPIVPATTYHYRVVATNSVGTTVGGDKQFTTLAPAAGGPLVQLPPVFSALVLRNQTVTVDKNGNVTLNVPCPATAVGNCVGTDTLNTADKVALKLVAARKKKKVAKLGSKGFSIRPGTTGKVKIKLSRKAFKYLKAKGKLKAIETVVAHDSRNVSKTSRAKLTLKAPKAKKRNKH